MKIEIPKIVRPLKLAEYAAEMGEAAIWVWVNPPKAKIIEYQQAIGESEKIQKAMLESITPETPEEKIKEATVQLETSLGLVATWYSEIWSQGPEDTRWTPEDIRELLKESRDSDPGLWTWLMMRTAEMIGEHRAAQKKG